MVQKQAVELLQDVDFLRGFLPYGKARSKRGLCKLYNQGYLESPRVSYVAGEYYWSSRHVVIFPRCLGPKADETRLRTWTCHELAHAVQWGLAQAWGFKSWAQLETSVRGIIKLERGASKLAYYIYREHLGPVDHRLFQLGKQSIVGPWFRAYYNKHLPW